MDIPSTDVIRHWCAWGAAESCPDEFMEHDATRVQLFEAWLQVQLDEAHARGVLEGRDFERKRNQK